MRNFIRYSGNIAVKEFVGTRFILRYDSLIFTFKILILLDLTYQVLHKGDLNWSESENSLMFVPTEYKHCINMYLFQAMSLSLQYNCTLRARSHPAKANEKAKSFYDVCCFFFDFFFWIFFNLFRFRFCFHLVWIGSNTAGFRPKDLFTPREKRKKIKEQTKTIRR